MRRRNDWKRDERGAITIMTALGMTVLLGSAAIAIDLGHMMNVRTESQRVADLAALAGAAAFVDAPAGSSVSTVARAWAINWAAQNTINGVNVTLVPTDIDVNTVVQRVDVTVESTAARGNPISTIFARMLGINTVDIVTVAAAEAAPADDVSCLLPLFLVDQWDERGGSPLTYDPGIDYYEPFVPTAPTGTYTGYDASDIGTTVILKPANGPPSQSSRLTPSWYFPFAGSGPGGSVYREQIQTCPNPAITFSIGDSVNVQTGALIGPTGQGFSNLIGQDPGAAFDPGLQCVMDASNLGSENPAHCRGSPRIRPVPMLDPSAPLPTGSSSPVVISNFSGVFVDRVQGNDVYVIIMGYTGASAAGSPSGGTPGIVKKLRLIK